MTRSVAAGLVALSIAGELTYAQAGNTSSQESTPPPVLTHSLRHGLDTTVSPCTDFDKYVNGGWRDSVNALPNSKPLDVLQFKSQQAGELLQRVLDSVRTIGLKSADSEERAVAIYYTSCLAADSLDRALALTSMVGAPSTDTARASRCRRIIMRDLQDALGVIFARAVLPSGAELRAQEVISQMRRAAIARVGKMTWLDATEKARIRASLESMNFKVARPKSHIDHRGLTLSVNEFEKNRRSVREYLWKNNVTSIGGDRGAVWMQTQYFANASYNPLTNSIEVPSFMFQWPFFQATGDDAMGYAGAGMIIAHEMYHGITHVAGADIHPTFQKLSAKLIAQYAALPNILEVSINGKGTINENLSDLGGLLVAYDAWVGNRSSKSSGLVERFTPEQRFFLHYARVFRANPTRDMVRVQYTNDPHAPSSARINGVVMNVPAFAKAFGCKEGDPMNKTGAERSEIW